MPLHPHFSLPIRWYTRAVADARVFSSKSELELVEGVILTYLPQFISLHFRIYIGDLPIS